MRLRLRPRTLRAAAAAQPSRNAGNPGRSTSGGGGAAHAQSRSDCGAFALASQRGGMADPEVLGFEHMGLDPRLLQVPGRAEEPGRRGRGGHSAARRLSRASCLLGRRRPGLVAPHADPGEGHPAGPGGEGPPGSGAHGLGEDGRLRHSDVAAAAPQEGGGSGREPEGREGRAWCWSAHWAATEVAWPRPRRCQRCSLRRGCITFPSLCHGERAPFPVLLNSREPLAFK